MVAVPRVFRRLPGCFTTGMHSRCEAPDAHLVMWQMKESQASQLETPLFWTLWVVVICDSKMEFNLEILFLNVPFFVMLHFHFKRNSPRNGCNRHPSKVLILILIHSLVWNFNSHQPSVIRVTQAFLTASFAAMHLLKDVSLGRSCAKALKLSHRH